MMTSKARKLMNRMSSPTYRHALTSQFISEQLAFQIHQLREANGWTQAELAEKMGKSQATISQWENPDYGRHTITTLKELSKAFDVSLALRFCPFSELANRMASLSREDLAPMDYQTEMRSLSWVPNTTDSLEIEPVWKKSFGYSNLPLISDDPLSADSIDSGTHQQLRDSQEYAYAAD